MKVKDLIKELKNMPKNLNVYYSHNDNSEYEIAGAIYGAEHMVKEDLREVAESVIEFKVDMDMFENNPDEWVILKG